jgi:hypothetical protein
MEPMVPDTAKQLDKEAIYVAFSRRLNEACDDKGIVRGRGRKTAVGALVNVGYKGATKWLDGQGMPDMGHASALAIELGVAFDWFMTGRGPKTPGGVDKNKDGRRSGMAAYDPSKSTKRLARLLELWPRLLDKCQATLLEAAEEYVEMSDPSKFRPLRPAKSSRRPPRSK